MLLTRDWFRHFSAEWDPFPPRGSHYKWKQTERTPLKSWLWHHRALKREEFLSWKSTMDQNSELTDRHDHLVTFMASSVLRAQADSEQSRAWRPCWEQWPWHHSLRSSLPEGRRFWSAHQLACSSCHHSQHSRIHEVRALTAALNTQRPKCEPLHRKAKISSCLRSLSSRTSWERQLQWWAQRPAVSIGEKVSSPWKRWHAYSTQG